MSMTFNQTSHFNIIIVTIIVPFHPAHKPTVKVRRILRKMPFLFDFWLIYFSFSLVTPPCISSLMKTHRLARVKNFIWIIRCGGSMISSNIEGKYIFPLNQTGMECCSRQTDRESRTMLLTINTSYVGHITAFSHT